MTSLLVVADAREAPPDWWLAGADDPRHTRGWAIGSRWAEDGVVLAGFPETGPFTMCRRVRDGQGYSRMNLVDACAGTYRGVEQRPGLVEAARARCPDQLVMATTGYATTVTAAGLRAAPGSAAALVTELERLAAGEAAVFGVLHVPDTESSLLAALRSLGFLVEIADVFAEIPLDAAAGFEGYLAGLDAKHRGMVRREHRRLAEARGEVRVHHGAEVEDVAAVIGALEAGSQSGRGIATDPELLAGSIRALAHGLGAGMAAAIVHDAAGTPVASCSVVSAGPTTLAKSVGLDRERARPLAGYFHATYYAPISIALARDAKRLVLGPGSLRPKLVRGAVLRPLWAAVRPSVGCLAEALRATGVHMRRLLENPAAAC